MIRFEKGQIFILEVWELIFCHRVKSVRICVTQHMLENPGRCLHVGRKRVTRYWYFNWMLFLRRLNLALSEYFSYVSVKAVVLRKLNFSRPGIYTYKCFTARKIIGVPGKAVYLHYTTVYCACFSVVLVAFRSG